jgi:SNF2 family DNA or RNA helicase
VRRDAELLARIDFDYVILDEAHAIKNVDSLTTKAVRLLRGRHRLALTGTPVQNHIGELWSLFEFLNPGMLGKSRAFARAMNSTGSGGSGSGSVSATGSGSGAGAGVPGAPRDALARVLRPFILRRTKADVARDLPERVEDTIVCRLSGAERQRYNELRDYYRQTLAQRITKEGWNKARLHVLKALLRLRQAACHPGLVDRSQIHASSAKLDVLLADLRLLREEGHKTIVFSQFVRLLDIVRLSLDRDGVPYEYLDGRTRDREARVERFQTDPDCPLFLVSLKAGGLGLNLTAAEYVFLLDPWWNPAIEAQAIDRAHRIGQTKAVFAYRLIAEDTIEEKIIELQDRKRDLADAVVGADGGALQKLTREDLEVLLS